MSHATDPAHPVARKIHLCDYCGGAIPRGQRYTTWCWIDDGTASTVKAHTACADIASAYYSTGSGIDGRTVSSEPLLEWALEKSETPGGLADALATMAAEKDWPAGEVERLVVVLG